MLPRRPRRRRLLPPRPPRGRSHRRAPWSHPPATAPATRRASPRRRSRGPPPRGAGAPPAGDGPCHSAGITAAQVAGSATHNRTVAPRPAPAPSVTTTAGTEQTASTTTVAALTTISGGAPAGTPLAPQDPAQFPSPATATAFGGCGGPGAAGGPPHGA